MEAARLDLAQPPEKYRCGRQALVRRDSAGGTHEFVAWLAGRAGLRQLMAMLR
ncbi:hypothetical protein ACFYW8_37665 [Streptomyces sp. NPDC002742]|uniref:hypothetical protein n=1 Tax=Streptomyces sp. NPDC002742 TaxID=3364663 RepID=UPI00369769DE